MRHQFAIGTKVQWRGDEGPERADTRVRVGVVLAYEPGLGGRALVGLSRSWDGHSGYGLAGFTCPAKYNRHCWFICADELSRVKVAK